MPRQMRTPTSSRYAQSSSSAGHILRAAASIRRTGSAPADTVTQDLDDAFRGVTVAIELRMAGRTPGLRECVHDPTGIGRHELIPSGLHGFDPFGFVTQRHARHLEPVRFFLHATRIGDDDARRLDERDHVTISDRL